MWIKLLILLALAAVFINLFIALLHLLRGGAQNSQKALRSLQIRLGISIAIFISLYVLAHFGYLQPHGVSPSAEYHESMQKNANTP